MFSVIVPVLSEQIMSVEPSVSTEAIFLMITFLLAISDIPRDNIMVITDDIPSGIAATANEMDNIRISKKSFFLSRPTTIITIIIPIMI